MVSITSKQLAELQLAHDVLPAIPQARTYKRGQGMNVTEQRYYDEQIYPRLITGEYLWCMYEGMRFRIGKGNAFYCPDFDIFTRELRLELHEVKGGFEREAARVRRKVAAQQYPFTFRLCKYIGGDWSITTI